MNQEKELIPIYQIDAFTDVPFKGNPAAVCLITKEYPDDDLQKIAAEMNLSETAFIYVPNIDKIKKTDTFRLRWFTPTVEVNLCGHATLASASVLFFEIGITSNNVNFDTLSGRLTAKKINESIGLNFPLNEPEDITPPKALLNAMGIEKCLTAAYATNVTDILLELENDKDVQKVTPNFGEMLKLKLDLDIRGVMITSRGSNNVDFVSRFFAPWVGINEDPVTGSAHTILTPYWSKKLGKTEMTASQLSDRGGKLTVKIAENNRVEIIGKTSLVLKGEFYL
ncbi:MAG: PhzF family phenazine biosynthesis protein [Candidatus Heimdallarchaeota archaeon]|nr:PhzF family phenazine biosynthesis protein [Candidatus Heimdallarchaeota archaeon]MCK4877250.1 PhzF family phenazine biosynthesis protein [Candidatus Heimdallarchaeota archaeon]